MIFLLKIIAWWFGVTIFLFAALCAKALYAEKKDQQAASKEPNRYKKVSDLSPRTSALEPSLDLGCAPNLQQMPQAYADTTRSTAAVGRSIM
jgi:hypothetical protein